MNISFKRKIPIAQCKIFDNEQNKFVGATVHEYDCKTMSDICEVQKLGAGWQFTNSIIYNMQVKNRCVYTGHPNNSRFFNIEKENGEIVGLALCEEKENSLNVNFIETKQNKKQKFAGQTLLAIIANYALDIGKCKLIIKNALKDSYSFYKSICGFKKGEGNDLEMKRKDIKKFTQQTEERIQSSIISTKA